MVTRCCCAYYLSYSKQETNKKRNEIIFLTRQLERILEQEVIIKIASRFEEMIKIQGFIYIYIYISSLSRFSSSHHTFRDLHAHVRVSKRTVSLRCPEIPLYSQSVSERLNPSLSLSPVSRLRTMLNRDAGNGDDDEEEWWENEEEETGPLILRTNEERKGGREKDEESEQTDCSNVASPSHR